MPSLTDNHFQLLGLTPGFAIEPAQLQAAYLALQSQVHPDRYAHGTDAEKRVAMQWATRINEAHQTLKNPVSRAAYWCELQGVPVQAEVNTAMPAAFLMQQMQWREALEDARNETALDALWQELQAVRTQTLTMLEHAIDIQKDAHGAAGLTRQLMFIDKFSQELDKAFERMEH